MTEWLSRVDAELPGAKVTICVDIAPYDSNGIPVWTCTAPAAGVAAPTVIKIGWTQSSTKRDAVGINAIDRASKPIIVLSITAGSVS